MATISDSIRSITHYPISPDVIRTKAELRGLDVDAEVVRTDREYNLVLADMLMWLSLAPNVSQGGVNYTFTDDQRLQFKNRARALYAKYGDDIDNAGRRFGYKGSRL